MQKVTDTRLSMQEGWTPSDLQTNRGGRLSQRQVEVLRHRMRRYLRGTFMWTVPIPLIAWVGAIVGEVVQGEPGYFVIPVLMTLCFSPLPMFVGWRVWTVRKDLAAGRVAVVEGPIAGIFVNDASGQSRVRIGTTPMQCYGPLWDWGWREGVHYLIDVHRIGASIRAYYLPQSYLFVAAEPVAQ